MTIKDAKRLGHDPLYADPTISGHDRYVCSVCGGAVFVSRSGDDTFGSLLERRCIDGSVA